MIDFIALFYFFGSWFIYSLVMKMTSRRRVTLNARMNDYRYLWMQQSIHRDNRIVDSTINASLQNGTAFFASTALFAIGGALSLFRFTEDIAPLVMQIPFIGQFESQTALEIKILGLALIFIYGFFKFSWAYRLFNYSAILIGAIPGGNATDEELKRAALRAARVNIEAGKEFNRGQRAFSFAVGYIGWFISSWIFILFTTIVLIALVARQYVSPVLDILQQDQFEEKHNIFSPNEMEK